MLPNRPSGRFCGTAQQTALRGGFVAQLNKPPFGAVFFAQLKFECLGPTL